jgi:hypothetical protein
MGDQDRRRVGVVESHPSQRTRRMGHPALGLKTPEHAQERCIFFFSARLFTTHKQKALEPRTSLLKRLLSALWTVVGTGLTVLAGIVTILTMYPRMTVTASFEETHPLSSTFLVSNDGYLPAYSVRLSCLGGNIDAASAPDLTIPEEKSPLGSGAIVPKYVPVVTLYPGEKELIPLSDCVTTESVESLTEAHVGLTVTYRPLLWFNTKKLTQEFYVRKLQKGTFKMFVWYSVPYHE